MILLITAFSYFVTLGSCQFEYGQEYEDLDPYEYEYKDLDPYKYESGKEEMGIDGLMPGSGFDPNFYKLRRRCQQTFQKTNDKRKASHGGGL